MAITGRTIRTALEAIPGALSGSRPRTFDELAQGADSAMQQAGITTAEGAACFIAQCMVESAYFRTTEEYGGANARYAPYYGRGFIQLTWKSNYARFGVWAYHRGLVKHPDYFVDAPSRAAAPRWAWLTAVYYFEENNLVDLANRGQNQAVGRGIHAGDVNADDRGYPWSDVGRRRIEHTEAAYRALLAAGVSVSGGNGKGDDTEKVVRALLDVDGYFGPATIKSLQRHLDVTADGVVGPRTIKAIQRWVGTRRDCVLGPRTIRALQHTVFVDGVWPHDPGEHSHTTEALQRWLNAH